jgi:photosystem II stability/assembly factor-like uncharacterized protein
MVKNMNNALVKMILFSFFIGLMLLISGFKFMPFVFVEAAGPSEAGGGAVIYSLEMDQRNPETIYAGTEDGLLRTKNEGASWEVLGLRHLIIWDIEASSNTIYAATNKGIYKSNDEGKSWDLISEQIGTPSIIAFSGMNPDIIYAGGSPVRTIFKSTDGGLSWRSLETSLPPEVFSIVNLEVDPSDPQVVYTRVQLARKTGEFTHELTGSKVLKSIDGGEHWSEISDFKFKSQNLVIDPRNPDIQYKATRTGVAKSKDGGKTWETLVWWITRSATSLIVDPANPDTIYVGTEGNGIWKSIDRGLNWEEAGLRGARIYSLEAVFDKRGGLVLAVAGTDQGIFKAHKSIQPATWDLVGDFGGYVTIDPRDYNIFYAGANIKIVRDPENPEIMFYGEFKEGEGGVLKSLDAGETWRSINNGIFKPATTFDLIKYITVDPYDSNIVYMINAQNGGVYKSINAGENWQRISRGLEEGYASWLAVAPNNTLYLGIYETKGGSIKPGVYRSRDGGQTWESTSLIDKKVRVIKIDSSTVPYTIYVGTYGQGAYKSNDEGESWIPLDEELITRGVSVNAIAIVPVLTTTSFHPPFNIPTALAASPQKSLVYLGTDEGVRVYEISTEGKKLEQNKERLQEKTPFQLRYFWIILSMVVAILFTGWIVYRKSRTKNKLLK